MYSSVTLPNGHLCKIYVIIKDDYRRQNESISVHRRNSKTLFIGDNIKQQQELFRFNYAYFLSFGEFHTKQNS